MSKRLRMEQADKSNNIGSTYWENRVVQHDENEDEEEEEQSDTALLAMTAGQLRPGDFEDDEVEEEEEEEEEEESGEEEYCIS